MDVLVLIDKLDDIIHNARSVPLAMTDRCLREPDDRYRWPRAIGVRGNRTTGPSGLTFGRVDTGG